MSSDSSESAPKQSLDLSELENLSFGPDWAEGRTSTKPQRSQRSPRSDRDHARSAGREGGGSRSRRPARQRTEFKPEEKQSFKPFELSLEILFYPEEEPFETLIKALRSTAKTYQLFDIARMILEKPSRFAAFLKVPAEKKEIDHLYVSLLDQMPFESEEAALNHLLENHLEKLFSVEEKEVEPPKGNFQTIGRCGMTQKLLAPPNYHRYQQILREHHAKHLPDVPFERFVSKVETVRDEALISEWLESMKKQTFYTPVYAPQSPESNDSEVSESAKETDSNTESELPVESNSSEEISTEEAPTEAPVEAPFEASPEGPMAIQGLDAARSYALSHWKAKLLKRTDSHRMSGVLLENMPHGLLRRNIEYALEGQRRFPLTTVNHLRGRFRRSHFRHFKWGPESHAYVCAVKPKQITDETIFADSIGHLIHFLKNNSGLTFENICHEYLGITLPPKDAPAEVQKQMDPKAAEMVRALVRDLRWLVTEGYVMEMSNGTFYIQVKSSDSQES